MDMEELRSDSTVQEDSTGPGQSKSLIANVYSTVGEADPDPYRDLSDWDVSEEDVALAYAVTSPSNGGALVRDNIKRLTSSGSHEEWYTELQVALAHRIAQLRGFDELPDGRAVEGSVPIMEQVSISGSDIMDYLREHPEHVTDLDVEALAEYKEEEAEESEDAEPAEADD